MNQTMRAKFWAWRRDLRMALSVLRQKEDVVPPEIAEHILLHHFQLRSFRCTLCNVRCRVEVSLVTRLEDDVSSTPNARCVECSTRKPDYVQPGYLDYAALHPSAMRQHRYDEMYAFDEIAQTIEEWMLQARWNWQPAPPAEPVQVPPPPPPPEPVRGIALQDLRAQMVRNEREQQRAKHAHYQRKGKRK